MSADLNCYTRAPMRIIVDGVLDSYKRTMAGYRTPGLTPGLGNEYEINAEASLEGNHNTGCVCHGVPALEAL